MKKVYMILVVVFAFTLGVLAASDKAVEWYEGAVVGASFLYSLAGLYFSNDCEELEKWLNTKSMRSLLWKYIQKFHTMNMKSKIQKKLLIFY